MRGHRDGSLRIYTAAPAVDELMCRLEGVSRELGASQLLPNRPGRVPNLAEAERPRDCLIEK